MKWDAHRERREKEARGSLRLCFEKRSLRLPTVSNAGGKLEWGMTNQMWMGRLVSGGKSKTKKLRTPDRRMLKLLGMLKVVESRLVSYAERASPITYTYSQQTSFVSLEVVYKLYSESTAVHTNTPRQLDWKLTDPFEKQRRMFKMFQF